MSRKNRQGAHVYFKPLQIRQLEGRREPLPTPSSCHFLSQRIDRMLTSKVPHNEASTHSLMTSH